MSEFAEAQSQSHLRRRMVLTEELIARCVREVPQGPASNRLHRADDDDRAALVERLLSESGEEFWVFAYGSLIWKPCFAPAAVGRGRALGWHRAFCLWMRDFRGTPDRPGLMMGLSRGGTCAGLLFRVSDHGRRADLTELVRRELPYREFFSMTRWIHVETATKRARALTFWAGRYSLDDPLGLPLEEVAKLIAQACGWGGSCAEYLYQTVDKLEEYGIRDRNLWRLQKLVAAEIQSWGNISEGGTTP